MIQPLAFQNRQTAPRPARPKQPTETPLVDADAMLYQLAGQILAASQATDDKRIGKLADYVTSLVTSDPGVVRELLMKVAADAAKQNEAPPPNPFVEMAKARALPQPAPPVDQSAVIAQAKEIIANLEKDDERRPKSTTESLNTTAGAEPAA